MTERPRPRVPWRTGNSMDMPHALAVEDTLATVRAAMFLVSLLAAGLDPVLPFSPRVVGLLVLLAVYSLAVIGALRLGLIRTIWHIAALHVVDTAGAIIATFMTGGLASPFSTVFLFLLLAAGYRWGAIEVWTTCGVILASQVMHAIVANMFNWVPPLDVHIVGLRLAYLVTGGVLVGYMAETGRRQRHRAQAASRILSMVRCEVSIVTAMHVVVEELLVQFSATHIFMFVEDEGREPVTVWQASYREGGARRAAVRMTQEPRDDYQAFLFPLPATVAAWMTSRSMSRSGAESGTTLALGVDGTPVPAPFPSELLHHTSFPWTTALGLSYDLAAHGLQARLFLFLPPSVRVSHRELRDLQVVMREVAPAVFNLYLQRRLQSRAGVIERARVSRALHDGVIQSLIGIEMQLEVMRRKRSGQIPAQMIGELTNLQALLGQEVLNVRDLMQLLKPNEVDARQLVEHLAGTVEQFRHRTGIEARFVCDVEEIDLTPRACREIAGIVQEALANVRKHSGATHVFVRLSAGNGSCQLIIDDNGKGLDFDGYLSQKDLDAQRKGPVLIKEGVRLLNGRLSIQSHPGFGTKLEITIPGKRHA